MYKILKKLSLNLSPIKNNFAKVKAITIEASKFQKQYDGFLIYQSNRTKSFKRLGSLLVLLGGYSSLLYLYVCDEITKPIYLPLLGMTAGALVMYEFKMRLTTNYITLDRRGEWAMIAFYKWLGFKTKTVQVPISDLLGIKSYSRWMRIPTFNYRFGAKKNIGFIYSSGMVQPEVFKQMMAGNSIKVVGKIEQNKNDKK